MMNELALASNATTHGRVGRRHGRRPCRVPDTL